MDCPNCKAIMKEGTLKLKAGGYGLPLATLKFNKETIGKDNYKPFVGLFGIGGKEFHAFKCDSCSYVLFSF
jgi:hypothetical protein